jgi:uncharacterized membrane protein SpoIIM required for sporulation
MTDAIRLRSSDFRREREAQWLDLEALVARVEKKGLRSLREGELHQLPRLYRAAVSGLSVARAISLDRALLDYLESLVARAYFCVYGVKPRSERAVRRFFAHGFPAAVRRCASGVLVALGLLVAGTVCGIAVYDADTYLTIMPEGMAHGRGPTTSTQDLRDVLYSGGDASDDELSFFATFLFTHNAKIGMFSFALGFALGIPAILLLFYNGLLLGAMAGLYASRGLSLEFWAWLLPHGVTELLAVALCGGAGLAVAAAVVAPGRHGRLHAIAETGRTAALVVLGACALFLVAGLIEGILRQAIHDVPVRWLTVAVTATLWATYFGLRGRAPEAT